MTDRPIIDYDHRSARLNRIMGAFQRPATEAGMAHLRRQIEVAMDTRDSLRRTHPECTPIADVTLLGIALARWLDGTPEEVIATLRRSR